MSRSPINKFARFLKGRVGLFWRWLTTKNSIGFVPISSRPSKWLSFNTLGVVFAVVVVLALGAGAASAWGKRSSNLKKLSELRAVYANIQNDLANYEGDVLHGKRSFEAQSRALNKVFELFERTTPRGLRSMPRSSNRLRLGEDDAELFELYGEYELHEDFEVPKSTQELNAFRLNVLATIDKLRRLESFVQFENKMTELIPTGWPITNNKGYKTSPFGARMSPFLGRGAFHTGVDIAAQPGTPIVASAEGSVVFAGTKTGYGHTVVLQHKFGYRTLYGHNSKLLVSSGQKVRRGQAIALLGNTGRSTGYHLHFEIRIDNIPIDPWPYLTN